MKSNKQLFIQTHYIKELELGKHYISTFYRNKSIIVKFIKVTKCGYNFLNINTNECILKQHLYPIKHDKNNRTFYLNKNFRII